MKPDWELVIRPALEKTYAVAFGDIARADLEAFDIIVPLHLSDYAVLRQAGAAVSGRCLFPAAEAVALCHDKYVFNRHIGRTRHHAAIPPMPAGEDAEFPCILKKRQDVFGRNSTLLRSAGDLDEVRGRIETGEYFIQAYVAGAEEFATHLLLSGGEIVYSLDVVYDMGADAYVKGIGHTHVARTLKGETRHRDRFRDILETVGFRDGTCCFDYKIVDGQMRIFELNPRFGASLLFDVARYLEHYIGAVRRPTPAARHRAG